MVLWFGGLAWVLVWVVFQDPAVDYRLVVAGALAPDVIDGVVGRAGPAHTLVFSAALLATVMVATRGRRRLRRHLLALPVGTFVHLVLDATWTRSRVFWWPFLGPSFGQAGIPSLGRPAALLALEELAGAVALVWCWRRFELADPVRRATFVRTGRLGPEFGGAGRRARR